MGEVVVFFFFLYCLEIILENAQKFKMLQKKKKHTLLSSLDWYEINIIIRLVVHHPINVVPEHYFQISPLEVSTEMKRNFENASSIFTNTAC